MSVHQCPQCELAFSFKTELEWHVREEHGRVPESSSSLGIPTAPR